MWGDNWSRMIKLELGSGERTVHTPPSHQSAVNTTEVASCEKKLKKFKQGKFKPDVSCSVQLLLRLLQHSTFPLHRWCPRITGLLALWSPSLAVPPGMMRSKPGKSETELTPTLPRTCPQLLPLWTSSLLSKLSACSSHISSEPRSEPCQS